jgi:uncharacterized CHY-type Zn-finger protein
MTDILLEDHYTETNIYPNDDEDINLIHPRCKNIVGVDNPNNHKVSYCHHCKTEMVVCGVCGNNTCNAGYGMINGETCNSCKSAYDVEKSLKLWSDRWGWI